MKEIIELTCQDIHSPLLRLVSYQHVIWATSAGRGVFSLKGGHLSLLTRGVQELSQSSHNYKCNGSMLFGLHPPQIMFVHTLLL